MGGKILGNKIKTDGNGNLTTRPAQLEELPFIAEAAAGTSTATLNINDALGRNAFFWEVINDGPGDFTVELSNDGTFFWRYGNSKATGNIQTS